MDGGVVAVAQSVELSIRQWRHRVREVLRDRVITTRQVLETQALARVLRQIEELFGIVIELLPRRRGQGFLRNRRPVVAAAQFVGAGEVIERPAALAVSEPEEPQDAVRLVMLRIELRGAAERLDGLLRIV